MKQLQTEIQISGLDLLIEKLKEAIELSEKLQNVLAEINELNVGAGAGVNLESES